ncbi:MAG: LodA/GoxA family CTQ-dependent oxidase [Acidobacteriota bacterium]
MSVAYRIHPAIGIARVGDSLTDYFVGPEAPGVPPTLTFPNAPAVPDGKKSTYKDSSSHVKRQGARFRIYEYTSSAAGAVTKVREITAADARIEWAVHLVNRKAAARRIAEGPTAPTNERRNKKVPENTLILDAGLQRISGASQPMARLQGRFMDQIDVPIGDLLTDAAGRLIVLGGFGTSKSVPTGAALESFANNDGWCDDTSDGPVQAKVTLNGAAQGVDADSAWVVVAPPDFAPPIENVVTLYDVVYDQAATLADPSLAVTETSKVSFTKDIFPLLRRVSMLRWVSGVAAEKTMAHGQDGPNDFVAHVKLLASNKADAVGARNRIFRALRNPQTGVGDMPKLPEGTNENVRGPFVTATQYARMKRWAEGTFDADWTGAAPMPLALDHLPAAEQPRALDRAALESCVGGPFYPGIEVSGMMLDATTYDRQRPFRINAQLPPGALTARMAIPWQADFRDCGEQAHADWWPGQRPTHVFRGHRTVAENWVPRNWTREDMVKQWMDLGFIDEDTSSGKTRYVEGGRTIKPV